jgi:hypothetical protein
VSRRYYYIDKICTKMGAEKLGSPKIKRATKLN